MREENGITPICTKDTYLQKNAGITLVALVITIIVMLILAGVTISMVLGNNGAITQSSKAVEATNMAKVNEEVSLALASIETEYYTEWSSDNSKKIVEYYTEGNLAKYLAGAVRYNTTEERENEPLVAGEEYIVEYLNVEYIVIFKQNLNGSYSIEGELRAKGGVQGEEIIQVSEITLSKTETTILAGETETLTATVSPENATNKEIIWTSSEENIATVDNGTITAVAAGTATITCTAADGSGKTATCSVTVTYPTAASKLKVGDYVAYTPTSQSYTMTTTQTGYTSDQTYTTSSYTGGWQVLYNDTTYGVQIISSDVVGSLYLSGVNGYNNLVGTLNTMAGKYVNAAYAKSGRSVGSLPSDTQTSTGTTELYTGSYTYFTTYGWNNKYKVEDTNYTSDQTAMRTAGVINISKAYWLGSRRIPSAASTQNYFGSNTINKSGIRSYTTLWKVFLDGSFQSIIWTDGVRSVISLKPDIEINTTDSTRDGTSADKAWILK